MSFALRMYFIHNVAEVVFWDGGEQLLFLPIRIPVRIPHVLCLSVGILGTHELMYYITGLRLFQWFHYNP